MIQPTPTSPDYVEDVQVEGHIIDSLLLPKVLDEILTRGGRYVIKDIRIGQRQTDPSYARIEVRAGSAEKLREILDAIHDHGAVPVGVQRLHPGRRPTWTGPFPRASTAPPTTAPRSRCTATGSRSRIRRWIAASWSMSEETAARCVPMTDVRHGRPDRRRPAAACASCRPSRRRGTTCSSSWPAPSRAKSPRA